jgi:hypothetical protein
MCHKSDHNTSLLLLKNLKLSAGWIGLWGWSRAGTEGKYLERSARRRRHGILTWTHGFLTWKSASTDSVGEKFSATGDSRSNQGVSLDLHEYEEQLGDLTCRSSHHDFTIID